MDIDMNNKHKAVIGVGILVLVFLIIAIWYMATHQAPTNVIPSVATSTTPAVTTTAGTQHIRDTGKYYDIDAAYPGSTVLAQTVGAEADAAAVAKMRAFLVQTIDQFKTNGNFENLTAEDAHIQGLDQGRMYALQAEYKTYQGPHTVSYVYTLYEDTLGAHPNGYYRTFTFDTATGAQLSLGDLFTSTNYLQTLSTMARADLPGIIKAKSQSDPDMDYITRGTAPSSDNFQNWYLDGATLTLVFAPYQVGPYALGTMLDPIPLFKLSGLKAKYQPEAEFSVQRDGALNVL